MVTEAGVHPQSSVEEGADAILRLATSPDVELVSGAFFDGQRESRAREQAYDVRARQRLRAVTVQLTGAPVDVGRAHA